MKVIDYKNAWWKPKIKPFVTFPRTFTCKSKSLEYTHDVPCLQADQITTYPQVYLSFIQSIRFNVRTAGLTTNRQ